MCFFNLSLLIILSLQTMGGVFVVVVSELQLNLILVVFFDRIKYNNLLRAKYKDYTKSGNTSRVFPNIKLPSLFIISWYLGFGPDTKYLF